MDDDRMMKFTLQLHQERINILGDVFMFKKLSSSDLIAGTHATQQLT